jgi:tetratricopeptide (TPR) repeat protein
VGVSEENRRKALTIYKTGNGHFEESRYSQALAEYLKAIPYWDHPAIRYNMAVCYINLDRTMEAFESLKKALSFGAEPLGQHHSQALTYMKLVRGRLAEITVRCEQDGVKVTLDGHPLLTGPGKASSTVLAGKHMIVSSLEGFVTDTKELVLGSGEKQELSITLVPLSKAVKMKQRFKTWIPWTVMSAGIVVAAIGVPLLLKAYDTFKLYNDGFSEECPRGCFPEERSSALISLHDQGSAYRASAYAVFGIGGAVTAAGVALVILNIPRAVRAERSEPAPGTEPVPGPGPGRGPGPGPSPLSSVPEPSRFQILPSIGPGFYGAQAEIRF